ncbi:unnamed protein product [Periconia digitata]|uniref:Methyltransferase type 11 domain-containing protein n=1 Tax=Periconia digitata TaxID=1303443 RepID=A0A9W4UDV1_9PLEO|nr:unnamed protein product [Periconia digitata]
MVVIHHASLVVFYPAYSPLSCGSTQLIVLFSTSDLTTMLLEDNTFDFVYVKKVIYHARPLSPACKELCRVLKPRGRGR